MKALERKEIKMTKLKTFLLGLLAAVSLADPAMAQFDNVSRYPTNHALGAASTDVGLLIRYVGTSPQGGTVEVAAATGDITLRTGVVGGSTADLTTECPVVTALGGVIDVSDAACNTLGEVVDAINSSPNWRAVLVDSARTESSDNVLATQAEVTASVPQGVRLLKDTTVALNVGLALLPFPYRNDISVYLDSSNPRKFVPNPYEGAQSILLRANGTFTGTGTDLFTIRSFRERYGTCGTALAGTPASIICADTEVLTGSYVEPGGGTGVNKTYDFSEIGLAFGKDEKVLVNITAATTFTAAFFNVAGFSYPYRATR